MSASDLTLAELQTELQARGFDYLSSTRQTYYLNQAYQNDVCEAEDWPFLLTTATGASPLTVSDLRTVESVVDSTQATKLRPMDPRNITDFDSSLATTGTPGYYYVTSTGVSTYPVQSDSLSVRYWKVPTALSGATDTPVIPNRWRLLIVDAAVTRALEDASNWDEAQVAAQSFQNRLDQMRTAFLNQQHDEPDDMIVAYDAGWDAIY